ncbi:MAG: hypothetical protein HC789_13700 [Microcoleus sp. CSU_2_2]|nr:hypothetical protein [Microcoleus sp. SU_5_3]NJS11344.1 hypothetical protein [Microcoleus sp. CSU_2_2]
MPFPYPKIIGSPWMSNSGHGNAVSLPQNHHQHSMSDFAIAQLIVGTRHCRLLTVSNL